MARSERAEQLLKALTADLPPLPRHLPPPAGRAPGPVTAGMQVLRKREPRPVYLALRLWPAIPPLFLILPALHRSPHLDLWAGNVLGLDATLCLVACITITPLVTLMRARAAALRWHYGIWMFALGGAGLALTVLLGMGNAAHAAAGDSVRWTGTMTVVLLVPMAATSSAAAQKLLGPEWKRWQRILLWTVWWLVAVHLAGMQAWLVLAALAGATAPLVILRRSRKSIRAWRSGGYSTGGWWFLLGVLTAFWTAGTVILFTELGLACAAAVTGH